MCSRFPHPDVKGFRPVFNQYMPQLHQDTIEWIRSMWPGKLILKGVLDVEDAKIAARTGCDAVVVSNHGGRQLDGAPSAISVLPRIADAIGDRTEVWMDSGVRSGQDILRSIALGAKACLIGKSWLYGLAAGGEEGVTKAIEILRKELDVSMALCGIRDVRAIDKSVLAS